MYKKTKYFITLVLLIGSVVTTAAQTIIFNESLTTQSSFNKFTAVSIKGDQVWYFNSQNPQYGAIMNGFASGASHENEDWLISPTINLQNVSNPKLTFDHTRGPASVLSVGVAQGWYKVYATANYTGNVATTTWIEITGVNHSVSTAWTFISSGELAIPEVAKSANTRIAFKYLCSNSQSATWEVKNILVTGTHVQEVDFKITTWNVEWLSCLTSGPSNRELQINNVVSIIKTMNSDLVALQEVGTSNMYKTIDTLVKRLGSEWAGAIVPWNNSNNCFQNQGIIYKKSKIQYINASLITNGGTSYQWANGRWPALYNVSFVVGNIQLPISFINIHAKAHTTATSEEDYIRRRDASIGLKNLLDGSAYNTKRVVVIGDFNDYLIGTVCTVCSSTLSPYKNFMDDVTNYKGITTNLMTVDHVIISNELFDNYLNGSAFREISATQTIPNYSSTTSNHIPTSVTFRIKETVNIEDYTISSSFHIYPNPTTGRVYIQTVTESIPEVKLFSFEGRLLQNNRSTEIDLSIYAAGIYFIQVNGETKKVIKN